MDGRGHAPTTHAPKKDLPRALSYLTLGFFFDSPSRLILLSVLILPQRTHRSSPSTAGAATTRIRASRAAGRPRPPGKARTTRPRWLRPPPPPRLTRPSRAVRQASTRPPRRRARPHPPCPTSSLAWASSPPCLAWARRAAASRARAMAARARRGRPGRPLRPRPTASTSRRNSSTRPSSPACCSCWAPLSSCACSFFERVVVVGGYERWCRRARGDAETQ
jgi:hypothetical protein